MINSNHISEAVGYRSLDRGITTIDTRNYTYDSIGQNILLTGQRWTPDGYVPTTSESGFDGDGNRVRENSDHSGSLIIRYYLRSTVLGGAIVEELDSSGQKQLGYVYTPSGTSLATQFVGQNYVMLKQISPLGTSQHRSFTTGSTSRIEFDPLGATVKTNSNSIADHGGDPGDIPSGGGGSMDSRFSSIGNPAAGCTLDGVYVPCSFAFRILRSGAAEQCPENDCGPQARWLITDEGEKVPFFTLPFMAFANGESGYYLGFLDVSPQAQADAAPYLRALAAAGANGWRIDTNAKILPFQPRNTGQQLSECLRNALREYFPQQNAQGKTYSPVDDSRFKAGIPALYQLGGIIPGTVQPAAITLGLFDIHYNPNYVNLSGGSSGNLKTILEEVSHTVQFLQVWAGLKQNPYLMAKHGIDTTTYESAQNAWQEKAFYHWAKAGGSYDNSQVELWAKKNANLILDKIVHDSRYQDAGNLCGFDLRTYHIIYYP